MTEVSKFDFSKFLNIMNLQQEIDLQSLPCTQPSWHRRQLLRVAKMLSKEDVDELIYLSEDFLHPSEAARISTGLDLMRCLEWHGRVGPSNYGYLLSCLREIGRIDIEMSLLKSASSIPFTPHSFGVMSQMLATKMSILRVKQRQYAAKMKIGRRTDDQTLWIERFNQRYPTLCKCLNPCTLPAETDAMEVLVPTLQGIFSGSTAWSKALEDLQLHQSSTKIAESVERAGKHVRNVYDSWDSINWMRHWRDQVSFCQRESHLIGSMSVSACSFFCELGSELLGIPNMQKETEKLSQALFIIESVSYMTTHTYIAINWLMSLCEHVATTRTNIKKYTPYLKSLLSQFADIISSCIPILEQIFQGTAVLDRMQEEGLLGKQDTTTATEEAEKDGKYRSCMSEKPHSLTQFMLPVTLLVLLNSDVVKPSDWALIHTHLLDYIKECKQVFCKSYIDIRLLVIQTLQHELDRFRDRVLAMTRTECGPGVQTLAMELLQY